MEQYDRDAPLFDRRLQVLVQYPDREEKLHPLTIRLLHGIRVRGSLSLVLLVCGRDLLVDMLFVLNSLLFGGALVI